MVEQVGGRLVQPAEDEAVAPVTVMDLAREAVDTVLISRREKVGWLVIGSAGGQNYLQAAIQGPVSSTAQRDFAAQIVGLFYPPADPDIYTIETLPIVATLMTSPTSLFADFGERELAYLLDSAAEATQRTAGAYIDHDVRRITILGEQGRFSDTQRNTVVKARADEVRASIAAMLFS